VQVHVVTLFPQMFEALTCGGITARAIERELLMLQTWNPRDYSQDRHRTVDDRPYGGGPGMVMMVEPLRAAIRDARQACTDSGQAPKTIYLSPQGRPIKQADLEALAKTPSVVLVAGRYEGIDERVIEHDVDEEWSIGDYVLSGGELPAMVMIDAIARQIPGVLGDDDSAAQDSFSDGLLDYPHYTRPESIDDMPVPDVLLKGDHQKIAQWRRKQALGRTWLRRPDMLDRLELSEADRQLLTDFVSEHGYEEN
jgi:tRNA (guanine37-N1)-methyltransferase